MGTNELNKKILKYLNNELNPSEAGELKLMLDKSKETKAYFNDIEIISKATKTIEIPEFDNKKGYKTFIRKHFNKPNKKIRLSSFLKVAVILIIGLIIGIVVTKRLPEKQGQLVEIHVKKGERVNISLPDGNKIFINSNTILKYPSNFKGTNRKIILEGEAYFEFQSDETNPIMICVRDNIIYGNNNSFNIKNYPTEKNIEIIVEKGWLSVFNPNLKNNNCVLEAGDKGTINDLMPLFIEKANNYNSLAWKTGKLEFEDTPLRIVAGELANCYNVSVEINNKIQYCGFSSTYDNENLDNILNDLQKMYDFKISREPDKIIINGNDC